MSKRPMPTMRYSPAILGAIGVFAFAVWQATPLLAALPPFVSVLIGAGLALALTDIHRRLRRREAERGQDQVER